MKRWLPFVLFRELPNDCLSHNLVFRWLILLRRFLTVHDLWFIYLLFIFAHTIKNNKDLSRCWPFLRILFQHHSDQLSHSLALDFIEHTFWRKVLSLCRRPKSLHHLKDPLPSQQLVSQNPQRPNIDSSIVLWPFKDLRRHVKLSAFSSLCSCTHHDLRTSEISDLGDTLLHHHVFRLDVPVDDFLIVKVNQCFHDLLDDRLVLIFTESLVFD